MTLIFLHGAGCTGEVFSEQLRAFPGSHAPNLPGHLSGGSPSSIAEFADAVEAYVREERLTDVVVCGHSMGGLVALELAIRGPQWLAGIVLLDSSARMRVAPQFLEGLQQDFETAARSIAGYFFADSTTERVEAAVETMRRVGPGQTLRDFRACDAYDALDRLSGISVPLLAVTGEADTLAPAKFALALTDRVPGAQARIVPGAGHFVMAERPTETNQAIAAFLRGLS